MSLDILSPRLTVPANSSRFFASSADAQRQPTGFVELEWQSNDPYVLNGDIPARLIAHDDAYCTSVVDIHGVIQVPTLAYLAERVLPHLPRQPRVVDIGCGQGEFVDVLRSQGMDAAGYDPVLRRPSSHLHRRYWDADEPPANLYVMRCVLPHVPDPSGFPPVARRL